MRVRLVGMIALLVLVVVVAPANAQDDEDYSKYPGYVDFSTLLPNYEPEEMSEIFLGEGLIQLAAAFTTEDEPELGQLLSNLKLIRVASFSLEQMNVDELTDQTERMAKKLESMNWKMLVRVKERGERAYIYLKYDDKKIAGLTVMSIESEGNNEAAFVNIVGDIDLSQIGKLGKQFHIDPLDSALKDLKGDARAPKPPKYSDEDDE